MPDPRNRLKWNATCKAYPAIADLQAVKEVVLAQDIFTVVVIGENNRIVYEVPPNTVCMSVAFSAMSNHVAPNNNLFGISRGANNFYLGSMPYGAAWTINAFPIPCPGAAGDKYFIRWSNCALTDILYSYFVAYIVPVY